MIKIFTFFPLFLSGVLNAQTAVVSSQSPKAEEFLLESTLRKIKITNESGNVEIVSGPANVYKIEYTKKDLETFQKHCRIDIVKIRNKVHVRSEKLIKKSGQNCAVDLKIISEKDDDIEISNGSGNVKFSGEIQDLEIKLGSGNFEGKGTISKAEVTLGSGNFKLESPLMGNLKLELGSGNADLDLASMVDKSKMKIRSGSGNIHFRAKTLAAYAELDFKAGAGNIDIKVPQSAVFESKLRSGMGHVKSDFASTPNSHVRIEANAGVGNVTLKKAF